MDKRFDTSHRSDLDKMFLNINKTKSADWHFDITNPGNGNETKRRVITRYPPRLVQLLQALKKECFDEANIESKNNIGKLINII